MEQFSRKLFQENNLEDIFDKSGNYDLTANFMRYEILSSCNP